MHPQHPYNNRFMQSVSPISTLRCGSSLSSTIQNTASNMHPAVRDATGYTLLLSSIVALAILLREGRKHKRGKSPFYILSTSDVFSTVLTAVALLLSRVEPVVMSSYDFGKNGGTHEHTEDRHRLPFSRTREPKADGADSNATLTTCDARDVFAQYGMLLAPLTNALLSLLTFAVQCNLNAACARRRCADVTRSSATGVADGVASCRRETVGASEDEKRESSASRGSEAAKNTSNDATRGKIARVPRLRSLRAGDKKPAGFLLVTGHWLLPFLVVATLYTAEYSDVNAVRRTEDAVCVLESNFPMSALPSPGDDARPVDYGIPATPLEINDHFVNEGTSNDTEVDRIISKVRDIVRVLLGENATLGPTVNSTDGYRSRNATEYTVRSNAVRIEDTNVTSVDGVIRGTNETALERNVSILHNLRASRTRITVYVCSIKSVFGIVSLRDLPKVASEEEGSDATDAIGNGVTRTSASRREDDDCREDARIASPSTKEGNAPRMITADGIAIARDTTSDDPSSVADSQTYADVIKRIRAAAAAAVGAHGAALKNHYDRSTNRHDGGKPRSKRNDRVARTNPSSIKDLLLRINDNFDRDTTVNSDSAPRDECLVSIEFLKWHLSILFFAIYLLPILFCCVLLIRGRRVCENALATLRARADLASTLLRRGDAANPNEDDKAAVVGETARSRRLFANDESACGQTSREGLDATQKETKGSRSGEANAEAIGKSRMEIRDKGVLSEVGHLARTFKTINASLILCVVLWTPIFLGTLLRIFLCFHAPQWLIDITFLGALSFGVVRNILNINIIKIEELCSDAGPKENRIHPAE